MLNETLEKIACIGRSGYLPENLNEQQQQQLDHLNQNGYVMFDHLVGSHAFKALLDRYQQDVEENFNFEFPVLSQSKIDPERDAELIQNNFLATPEELATRGLTFARENIKSYEEMLASYEPSTLKIKMPDEHDWYNIWLDEKITPIIEAYMGFVPNLTEAYIRRNFPAKYKVMNHAWHRDRNHKTHLLKAFIFLSDCTMKTGPHHYIAGSVNDRRIDGKNYFTNDEIRAVYPEGDYREIISVVPAGIIILEDTRGLHKAGIPAEGHRDLGFATFVPPIAIKKKPALFEISDATVSQLTNAQQKYIPSNNII